MKDTQNQERYEDALFALLMQRMWEEQGQEEQDQPPEAAGQRTTDELDRRCLSAIRTHYGKARRRKTGKTIWKIVSRAAIAACIAITLFAVAYASSEKVRVNTRNLLITVFPTNTEFRFSGEMEEDRAPSLSVGWVPPGYTLTEMDLRFNAAVFDYYDDKGNLLNVECHSTDGMAAGFDTEDAVVEDVTIQGEKGMLIEKDGEYQLAWTAKNNTRLITVWSYALSREETLAVANSLVYD